MFCPVQPVSAPCRFHDPIHVAELQCRARRVTHKQDENAEAGEYERRHIRCAYVFHVQRALPSRDRPWHAHSLTNKRGNDHKQGAINGVAGDSAFSAIPRISRRLTFSRDSPNEKKYVKIENTPIGKKARCVFVWAFIKGEGNGPLRSREPPGNKKQGTRGRRKYKR